VARLWLNDQPQDRIIICDDIEGLRDMLRFMGLIKLMRSPDDDPVIMETWI
jgi:hypothetical protein